MFSITIAELECHAAKYESEQHDQNRKINRRDNYGEGKRKGCKKCKASEHQPSLIAVPNWRDGVHYKVARGCIWRKPEQHPDPEIKSVEQYVKKYANTENKSP